MLIMPWKHVIAENDFTLRLVTGRVKSHEVKANNQTG